MYRTALSKDIQRGEARPAGVPGAAAHPRDFRSARTIRIAIGQA